ncbi:MAG: AAA family ATPase [Pseudomonadales bacterium]|nr:AAA family ATPase [Pseudomonadales bacterium]
MSRYIGSNDSTYILPAAREWVDRCIVDDGSILSEERLWTLENFRELERHYVQSPDQGSGTLNEKLEAQLATAPAPATRLMAEVVWAVLLFPSNIGIERKRTDIRKVWSWSGSELPDTVPMLDDAVLSGIGSGGPGINNHRWRELVYLVGFGIAIKSRSKEERARVFSDYDAFLDWIETVPIDGVRQFPLMLRYLLFPDRVERMSSDIDRRKVLAAFQGTPRKELRSLSARELDERLLDLRRHLSEQYETEDIDFYEPPLKERWNSDEVETPETRTDGQRAIERVQDGDDENYSVERRLARNVIYFGPPGTGKTYTISKRMSEYTDQPTDVDRADWLLELVGRYRWRSVIAAALSLMPEPVRVHELEQHPLLVAKARERNRTDVRSSIRSDLMTHTSPEDTSIGLKDRREPYVFQRNSDHLWSLAPVDLREEDPEAASLLEEWHRGPGGVSRPVHRYRLVTFHPSYSYEDFVIGLRPTAPSDESSPVGFELVPGTFMQICAAARSNPGKRYALFIDEINRADIARVFGELITLIEPDKRARYGEDGRLISGLEVQLPGTSSEAPRFGVPANLDIYGTMNTADRSIALLDIALRRRFEFEELPPRYADLDLRIEGVHLGRLLQRINDRLEFLLDREHRIGHAYLMKVGSMDDLRRTFAQQIIPLLQEFFFDDWGRVATVLSTDRGRSPFIRGSDLDANALFHTPPEGGEQTRQSFSVTHSSEWTAEDFRAIYESAASEPMPEAEQP